MVIVKFNLDVKQKELENVDFQLNVANSENNQMKKELDEVNDNNRSTQRDLEKLNEIYSKQTETLKITEKQCEDLQEEKLELEEKIIRLDGIRKDS